MNRTCVLSVFSFEILLMTALVAIISAALGVFFVGLWAHRSQGYDPRDLQNETENSLIFLFDNETLFDATKRAAALLATQPNGPSDWQKFCTLTRAQFPELPSLISRLATEGSLSIPADNQQDKSEIRAEWWNGVARIEIVEDDTDSDGGFLDQHSMKAMNCELETLRKTAEMSPYLVWQQTAEGGITWANSSYLALAKEFDSNKDGEIKTWPPVRLFKTVSLSQGTPEGRAHRVSISFDGDDKERWFEVFSSTIGSESIHFATNANNVVRAETALREFVQTLTKTFAHLPTGLAIFDKKRQLTLFNPALTDLTGLQPVFLSLRPTLISFLDKLRESRVIPEPKDYKSWRTQISALEAAAADGTYSESWTLPSGQTYRVTGRPHPDGAIAFLFEDISSEVSLTRQFRSELAAGQAVLDSFSDAIAVFAPDGMLMMSNVAYANLWGVDPGVVLGEMTVSDALIHWREKCAPNAIWNEVLDYFKRPKLRNEHNFQVRLLDGRLMPCRISPISNGSRLIAFEISKLEPVSDLNNKPSEQRSPLILDSNSRINQRKDTPLLKIEA